MELRRLWWAALILLVLAGASVVGVGQRSAAQGFGTASVSPGTVTDNAIIRYQFTGPGYPLCTNSWDGEGETPCLWRGTSNFFPSPIQADQIGRPNPNLVLFKLFSGVEGAPNHCFILDHIDCTFKLIWDGPPGVNLDQEYVLGFGVPIRQNGLLSFHPVYSNTFRYVRGTPPPTTPPTTPPPPPIHARFEWHQRTAAIVRFDAGASEPTGLTFRWNFGDDVVETTTNPVIEHSYAQPGSKRVELTITDSRGRTDTIVQQVDVAGLRVNSAGDQGAEDPSSGLCSTGATVGTAPECTLRAALEVARDGNVVTFAIPGGGTPTIAPTTPLPAVPAGVSLDASSQPGGRVQLDGTGLGADAVGLQLAARSTIQGFAIGGFRGVGVRLAGGTGANIVAGNLIGTNVAGTSAVANGIGIEVSSPGNRIGGPGSAGNVVSGNTTVGVVVKGSGAAANTITGNRVGVDAGGDAALPNAAGVVVDGAPGTVVGTTAVPNTVAANQGVGILVSGEAGGADTTGVRVEGNLVGLGEGGSRLPNMLGVWVNGVAGHAVTGTVVGHNTVSANRIDVLVSGATAGGTLVQDNQIGTTAAGSDLGPPGGQGDSRMAGVRVDGAPGTIIERNTLASHEFGEIVVHGSLEMRMAGTEQAPRLEVNWFPQPSYGGPATGTGTIIRNNAVGTLAGGARTDAVIGVLVAYDAHHTTVGPSNTIGNSRTAAVFARQVRNLRVIGNSIGLTPAGHVAPNVAGVFLLGTVDATVGGATAGEGNRISANTGAGIIVSGDSQRDGVVRSSGGEAVGNVIQGNLIGTSAGGAGNGFGILLNKGVVGTLIGGPTAGAANVITGNTTAGILVSDGGESYQPPTPPADTRIEGNRVGINPSGGLDPNGPIGIGIGAATGTELIGNRVHGHEYGVAVSGGAAVRWDRNLTHGAATSNLRLEGDRPAPPVLGQITTDTHRTTVEVRVPATGGPHELQLYSNAICRDGPPEARGFLGAVTVPASPDLQPVVLEQGLDAGAGVTALVVGPGGTSELSACAAVELPPHIRVILGPNGERIVLTAPEGVRFTSARSVANPSPDDAPDDANFPLGFIEFALDGVPPGGSVVVEITLPPDTNVDRYFRHGPLGDGTTGWYEWDLDPSTGTGAQFVDGKILLHFVDGGRGDDDGQANGSVSDPGGPAVITAQVPSTTEAPPVTDGPSTTAAPATTAPAGVAPVTAPITAATSTLPLPPTTVVAIRGQLPSTGGESLPVAAIALVVTALGTGMIIAAARPRPQRTSGGSAQR